VKERFARIAALASLLALAGCDPDDVGGTLDGSVCGLAFDSVRAVRGGAELTIQYQKGRETALGVSVDPADIVEGEAIPLPPTGALSFDRRDDLRAAGLLRSRRGPYADHVLDFRGSCGRQGRGRVPRVLRRRRSHHQRSRDVRRRADARRVKRALSYRP
jgi:hypothetical protein